MATTSTSVARLAWVSRRPVDGPVTTSCAPEAASRKLRVGPGSDEPQASPTARTRKTARQSRASTGSARGTRRSSARRDTNATGPGTRAEAGGAPPREAGAEHRVFRGAVGPRRSGVRGDTNPTGPGPRAESRESPRGDAATKHRVLRGQVCAYFR